jgi:hypothetical protein
MDLGMLVAVSSAVAWRSHSLLAPRKAGIAGNCRNSFGAHDIASLAGSHAGDTHSIGMRPEMPEQIGRMVKENRRFVR